MPPEPHLPRHARRHRQGRRGHQDPQAFTAPFITLTTEQKRTLPRWATNPSANRRQWCWNRNQNILPAHLRLSRDEDHYTADYHRACAHCPAHPVSAGQDGRHPDRFGQRRSVASSEGYALMKLFGKAGRAYKPQQAMQIPPSWPSSKGDNAAAWRRPGKRQRKPAFFLF